MIVTPSMRTPLLLRSSLVAVAAGAFASTAAAQDAADIRVTATVPAAMAGMSLSDAAATAAAPVARAERTDSSAAPSPAIPSAHIVVDTLPKAAEPARVRVTLFFE